MSSAIRELKNVREAIVKLTNFLYPPGQAALAPIPERFLGAMITAINMMASQAIEAYPPHHMSNERSEDTLLWNSLKRIALLTSGDLRSQQLYCGDMNTIAEVWDEASREPRYSNHGRYIFEGGLRSVTFSETWGPVPCEHEEDGKRCGKHTFAIYVSKDELESMPYETGPYLINYVINGKDSKGKALCTEHSPALLEGAELLTL